MSKLSGKRRWSSLNMSTFPRAEKNFFFSKCQNVGSPIWRDEYLLNYSYALTWQILLPLKYHWTIFVEVTLNSKGKLLQLNGKKCQSRNWFLVFGSTHEFRSVRKPPAQNFWHFNEIEAWNHKKKQICWCHIEALLTLIDYYYSLLGQKKSNTRRNNDRRMLS